MGKHKKWIQIVILTAVVLIGAVTIGGSLFSEGNKAPAAGDKAPAFTLSGLDGKQHSLSDYKGKYVLVNFWGTFCPPCVEEMPAIQSQYHHWNKEKPFEVLGINLSEDAFTVKSFMNQYGLNFPVALDTNRTIEKKYGLVSYPTSFFIGPDGRIVEMYQGGMDETMLKLKIEKLLSAS
ncbi:redoxin family protein [Paenibacillus gansuensis]|uniref:Redoxin family protein n=1 Tax=Paenibacillus gansuensis TaxID=306542 RepID=A0ABW5PAS0_9BACL